MVSDSSVTMPHRIGEGIWYWGFVRGETVYVDIPIVAQSIIPTKTHSALVHILLQENETVIVVRVCIYCPTWYRVSIGCFKGKFGGCCAIGRISDKNEDVVGEPATTQTSTVDAVACGENMTGRWGFLEYSFKLHECISRLDEHTSAHSTHLSYHTPWKISYPPMLITDCYHENYCFVV